MGIVVQKFGGTSVGSVERIRKVADTVTRTADQGHQVVVVVSAMGKSTDELVDLAFQISERPAPREMDMLLTTGEQVTIALLTMALQERGYKARSMTGWQAGIQTDPVHGKALVKKVDTKPITESLERGEIVVVAGFQGISADGQITTLGRGGSDTTAVTLAAALHADYCEIYTDVTGVYTADPRVVPLARKIDEISYEEMLELAHLGAGVLHPRSVEGALLHQVHLVVRSSFVDEPGTWVKEADMMETELNVRGIAHDLKVARIKVLGLPNRENTLTRLFACLADAHINVDMIVQSEHDHEHIDVAFSVDEGEGEEARQVLQAAKENLGFAKILSESGLAKVSAVGVGMMTRPGVAAKMFATLSEAGIRIKMVSTSEIKISCVVEREDALEAVQRLHHAFGLDAKELAEVAQ
ncbi:aspartate kinase [Paenactinomyces guangxiensis]|uniref:Aspartokinase n=1 Tax=Paenactinomyces guangxiensis TaxID=1490290 RepID=A0A7W1WRA2_9BACL|nr:aspartate kinase [Paenactinomyces guangxiensis]MBA4494610.1 aspartate kinase [Paenactinomyces guangxiensis]MBH8591627.1 aspartate kinase [Paenactinomyces guangxiensis]